MSRSSDLRPWQLLAVVAILLALLFGAYELLERMLLVEHLDQAALNRLHIVRGLIISLLIAGVVTAYLRGRLTGLESVGKKAPVPELIDRQERGRQSTLWLIQMRWVAGSVALVLIVVSVPVLNLLPSETLVPLFSWWSVLIFVNLLFAWWADRDHNWRRQLTVQALADLTVLTGFLNGSGGIENPLYMVYVFHVILAGILLPRRKAMGVTAVAMLLYLFLAAGEYFHILPHYTNVLFPHGGEVREPQVVQEEPEPEEHEHGHAAHDLVFVAGRTLPFLVVLLMTASFTGIIMRRVRRGEEDLEAAASQALLERRRLESVLDASGIGMMQLGTDATVTWLNRRVSDWLDWTRWEPGETCPLLQGTQGCPRCIAKETAETGTPLELERRAASSSGGAHYYRHSTSPVKNEDGKVIQVVEVIEDITMRKALEAEAAHAAKLSALGRMAAGVAHEIGNPLSSLSARLTRLKREPDPAFVEQSVGVLRSQIDRISRIVHGVSHFARLHREGWTRLDLNSLVRETVGVVELDRRAKGIEFALDLAEPSPQLLGVQDQLSQVVLNLLLNAVEALPGGGKVSVSSAIKGQEVCLIVTDSGEGIEDSALDHLFEPFFTTKEGGTGLGLSISYSLVHAHGGRMEAESLAGGAGAQFRVILPLASGSPRPAQQVDTHPQEGPF